MPQMWIDSHHFQTDARLALPGEFPRNERSRAATKARRPSGFRVKTSSTEQRCFRHIRWKYSADSFRFPMASGTA